MPTSKVLSIIGFVVAGLVTFSEVNYYLTHPYRHGVAPHIIGLGLAAILISIAQVIKSNNK